MWNATKQIIYLAPPAAVHLKHIMLVLGEQCFNEQDSDRRIPTAWKDSQYRSGNTN